MRSLSSSMTIVQYARSRHRSSASAGIVFEAGSGGAALELLDCHPETELAVIDFAMPGMNGAEVARQAASRRPGLPLVFVTGYVDTAAIEDNGEERIKKKPCMREGLANKVD